jgi:pilus assembly protein Flp/PilA
MRKLITRFRRDEDGPAMVEYGLLVGLIALVVALGAFVLGQDISIMFSNVGSYLKSIPIPG